jgi:S-DNA-T family DNA segregation ATPase FtsK/SpoIIIE
VLRMTTSDDYLMLGVPGNVLDADSVPGAGLLGKRSVQIQTTGGAGTPLQAERIETINRLLVPRVQGRPTAPVPPMPGRLDQSALPAPRGARAAIALVSRSDRPPTVIRETDYVATAAAVDQWLAERSEDGWALVMVDNAHLWDAGAGVDEARRTARDRLLGVLGTHGHRIGLVATADTAQAKARGGPEGLVETARRNRRGFLLTPEWADGDALGASVPTKTTEPLTGPGRGVWCDNGTAWVAQIVHGTAPGAAQDADQEMR